MNITPNFSVHPLLFTVIERGRTLEIPVSFHCVQTHSAIELAEVADKLLPLDLLYCVSTHDWLVWPERGGAGKVRWDYFWTIDIGETYDRPEFNWLQWVWVVVSAVSRHPELAGNRGFGGWVRLRFSPTGATARRLFFRDGRHRRLNAEERERRWMKACGILRQTKSLILKILCESVGIGGDFCMRDFSPDWCGKEHRDLFEFGHRLPWRKIDLGTQHFGDDWLSLVESNIQHWRRRVQKTKRVVHFLESISGRRLSEIKKQAPDDYAFLKTYGIREQARRRVLRQPACVHVETSDLERFCAILLDSHSVSRHTSPLFRVSQLVDVESDAKFLGYVFTDASYLPMYLSEFATFRWPLYQFITVELGLVLFSLVDVPYIVLWILEYLPHFGFLSWSAHKRIRSLVKLCDSIRRVRRERVAK
jgi:hypothetical protein